MQVHLAQNVDASTVMVRVVGPMESALKDRKDTLVSVLADIRDRA